MHDKLEEHLDENQIPGFRSYALEAGRVPDPKPSSMWQEVTLERLRRQEPDGPKNEIQRWRTDVHCEDSICMPRTLFTLRYTLALKQGELSEELTKFQLTGNHTFMQLDTVLEFFEGFGKRLLPEGVENVTPDYCRICKG
ncbi:MAG: hypothetical protein QF632_05135 [Candidatus Woesearchaeota archaeon]|jgi:hypothetical protein|nr:hypothetical protein [Candidatus Woesearchaeota archaeon]MDP7324115.1 hypothetical protein [Candidatus Woesearchaeota archaeon]MDP7457167.1 hypothetical protein [Candidatus Woesearchaeota archaeon]